MGLASQTVLPISSSGSRPGGAFGVEEAARGVHRAVGLDAVLPRHHVVFVAVAGRGVDGAGALLERDVVGQNAERIALQERMAEDRAFERRAGERAPLREYSSQPHFSRRLLQQVRGDDVDLARRPPPPRTRTWGDRRWPCWPGSSRAWWSRSGRRPCARRARDRSSPDRDTSGKRTQIDGLEWFCVLDLGFGQRGAVVRHQCTGQALVDVAAVQEIDERAGDHRLVLRAHGQVRIVPAPEARPGA